eukprot:439324_1
MYQFPLGVNSLPIFGAAWAPVKSKEQDDDLLYSGGIFFGGGGGARRSGVENRILFYSIEDAPVPYRLVHETDTYPCVCSSIAVDTTGKLLAACFGKSVHVYAIAQQGLVSLVEFVADQAPKDSHVTSLIFGARRNGKVLLATGGEDAVVRVWNIDISVENLEMACNVQPPVLEVETHPPDIKLSEGEVNGAEKRAKKGEPKTPQLPSLEDRELMCVALDRELKEHTKCITCVRWHARRKLILSSGKDGFVCLWNSYDGSLLSKLATSSGLPSAGSSALSRVQCRSCAISPSGSTIYTIQCGARGKAYATLWNEQQLKSHEAKASSQNATVMGFIPSKVSAVSDSPVTAADIRDDGGCMAVGNVDGKISTWSIKKHKFQKLAEYAAHDLPVTSMAFISDSLESSAYDLLATSADYKITLICSMAPPRTSAFMTVINTFACYLWGFLEALSTLLLVGIMLVFIVIVIHYLLFERDEW